MKKYQIIIDGIEYGASGHNLSKKEFDSLINTVKNLSDIQTVLPNYEQWSPNFWSVSKPLKNDKLVISLKSES